MAERWYEKIGNDEDICISTRARLARNIKGFPFGERLDGKGRKKIIELVDDALSRADIGKADYINFDGITENKAYSYFEKHYISSDFLAAPMPKQLILSDVGNAAIMVNEEDHIRIQSIVPGFDIDTAYDTADKIDDLLSESIDFCFDEKLGYLTKCPTNLGTGLRLSVMMHLPCLTMTKQIAQIIKIASQLGFTVRGYYGEGSEAKGYLYQISNQETLGFTEKQICDKMKSLISQLIERERTARKHIYASAQNGIEDMVSRAEGTLRYAKLMSSDEYVKLYSDLRLGISLGIIDSVDYKTLNTLLINTCAHTLYEDSPALPKEEIRDKTRAELIQKNIQKGV